MFSLTYEFRLQPTKQQIEVFQDWLEINRQVYNHALAERKHWYNSRSYQVNACSLRSEYVIPADTPRPTFASQCKSLTTAKEQYPELKKVAAQVLQQTLKRQKVLLLQCGSAVLVFQDLRKLDNCGHSYFLNQAKIHYSLGKSSFL